MIAGVREWVCADTRKTPAFAKGVQPAYSIAISISKNFAARKRKESLWPGSDVKILFRLRPLLLGSQSLSWSSLKKGGFEIWSVPNNAFCRPRAFSNASMNTEACRKRHFAAVRVAVWLMFILALRGGAYRPMILVHGLSLGHTTGMENLSKAIQEESLGAEVGTSGQSFWWWNQSLQDTPLVWKHYIHCKHFKDTLVVWKHYRKKLKTLSSLETL